MAESPQVTTTIFIPTQPVSNWVILDPFFRPGAVGNGRMWISGRVAPHQSIDKIQYRINGKEWRTAVEDLESGDRFGFYIAGNEPSDWGTVNITEFYQPSGTYYFAPQVTERPKIFTADGEYFKEVFDISEMLEDERSWVWQAETQEFFFRTPADLPPLGNIQAIIDPIFEQGQNYVIEVRLEDSVGQTVDILQQEFVWAYQVRNYVDRYLNVLLPEYATDSPAWRKIYTVQAKQAADRYSLFDDCVAQFFSDFTTWGIGMWEDQIGLPTIPSMLLETRRQLIKARRRVDPTRNDFFDTILQIVPGAVITETYTDFRVDIKLTGVVDLALRRSLEKIIQEKKPVGIRVVVSYGQFIAGISLAGDTL